MPLLFKNRPADKPDRRMGRKTVGDPVAGIEVGFFAIFGEYVFVVGTTKVVGWVYLSVGIGVGVVFA